MSSHSSSPTVSPQTASSSIILRRAKITEGEAMGKIAAKTHFDTPMAQYLNPHKAQYKAHFERRFIQRVQGRLLDPRSVSIIACEASHPERPVGYAQFIRLGDDEGAKRQIESRKSVWLSVLGYLFRAQVKVWNFIVGDKSADPAAETAFSKWHVEEEALHWSSEERKNRWHTQSVVVLEEFQGKGIGKRLMGEVIEWAEQEGVVIGLEASEIGRLMYLRVGFELLAEFLHHAPEVEGGGLMLYTPKSLKGTESS